MGRRELVEIRLGNDSDFDAAIKVWRASNTARRNGVPLPDSHEARVRNYADNLTAFMVLAEDHDEIVGMGLGMQGLADHGAGSPIDGLCHISMVFVAPDRWGERIGGKIVERLLSEARLRNFRHAQLWSHANNSRAQRLYERCGFARSGREMFDDSGEPIWHYELDLSKTGL